MTTIAEKLTLLNSTKTAIAAAIEAKGVTVGAAPFADYALKIGDITSGSIVTPWVRPVDWPALPTLVEGDQRCVGLHAVYENDGNFCALSAAGNYTVDWGDGVIENYAANVVAYHIYDFTNANLSAVTSRGYKCAVVSVTPQAGQSLTVVNLNKRHNQTNLNTYSSGFVDICVAGQLINSLVISSSAPTVRFTRLEQFTFVGSNLITNFSYFFNNCYSLRSIPSLYTSGGLNFLGTFYNCFSLKNIPLLNTSAGTNFSSMFYASGIVEIPEINTISGVDFSSMFNNCYSLTSVPLLNTSNATNLSSMFGGCSALTTIPLLDTSACTNFSSMFGSDRSLRNIPLLNTSKGTNFSGMFSGARNLESVPLLNTSAGTNFSNMFQYCETLCSIPALSLSGTSSSSYTSIFNGCSDLANIDAYGFNYSFSVSFSKLSAAALNKLYGNLATNTGQTITVLANWGIALDDPTIATAKGWTVTG